MLEKSPERKQWPAIVGKRGTVSVHCQGDQAGSLVYYIRTFYESKTFHYCQKLIKLCHWFFIQSLSTSAMIRIKLLAMKWLLRA
jgi:hypothetical protein